MFHPSHLSSIEDLSVLDQQFEYEEKFRVDRRKLEHLILGEGEEKGMKWYPWKPDVGKSRFHFRTRRIRTQENVRSGFGKKIHSDSSWQTKDEAWELVQRFFGHERQDTLAWFRLEHWNRHQEYSIEWLFKEQNIFWNSWQDTQIPCLDSSQHLFCVFQRTELESVRRKIGKKLCSIQYIAKFTVNF